MSGPAPALRYRYPLSPMPDRLDELRKQRALVQQHLTWLDHEIAAVTVTRLTLPPFAMRGTTRPPMSTATTPPIPGAKPVVIPELSEFQVNPDDVKVDTRKGCILYTALAFVILVLVLVVIYFVGYRDSPVLFVPKSEPTVVYPPGAPNAAPAPAKRTTPAPAPANPPPK